MLGYRFQYIEIFRFYTMNGNIWIKNWKHAFIATVSHNISLIIFMKRINTWKWTGHWRIQGCLGAHGRCGTRTYNGCLGQRPQRGPGAKPLVREWWGRDPHEAEHLYALSRTWRIGQFVLKSIFTKQKFFGCLGLGPWPTASSTTPIHFYRATHLC